MEPYWTGEVVGVLGIGRSGQAVVEAMESEVRTLVVYDDGVDSLPETVRESDRVEWWSDPDRRAPIDRWIVSPGVPPDHERLIEARKRGIPIETELEVGFELARGPVWAVTGTNGKTSTVHLIGALLETVGNRPVEVCGNCGHPFTTAAHRTPEAHFVVEVSSFQAEALSRFRPGVTVLTGLGEDHIDRHGSVEHYHELKRELVRRARFRAVVPEGPGDPGSPVSRDATRVRFADTRFQTPEDNWNQLEMIVEIEDLEESVRRFPRNLTAALAALDEIPTSREIRQALTEREQLPYRAESLQLHGNRTVVNDSKATNPGAVLYLLERTRGPYRLLLGGNDKDLPLDGLIEVLEEREPVEVMVAGTGDLARRLQRTLKNRDLNLDTRKQWEPAVKDLIRRSRSGETILLSPAGTSFDAFDDYRDRGDAFRHWVEEVKESWPGN